MIKIVPDTNVILRGMMGYNSVHRAILNLAADKKIVLFGSKESFEEFCEKVSLPRFDKYWKSKIFSKKKIIMDYQYLVNISEPSDTCDLDIDIADPDDIIFFRIAKSSNSKIIISEDKHVINVKHFGDIITTTPEKFIESYKKRNGSLYI